MGVSFARASAESRTKPKRRRGKPVAKVDASSACHSATSIPRCGGALLGIGNKGFEARIALKELKAGVLLPSAAVGKSP